MMTKPFLVVSVISLTVGVTLLGAAMEVQARVRGHASVHRSANVYRGPAVNTRRSVNVNTRRSVDVYRRGYGWGAGAAAVGMFAGLAIGAAVASPPPSYTTVVVEGTNYAYADGVYYQPAPQGSGYTVVTAPVGATIAALPPGVVRVGQGGASYFYLNGTFYIQQGTVFQVVPPPIGVMVPVLPQGATATMVNGQDLFIFGGTYYQPVISNGQTKYMTVAQ